MIKRLYLAIILSIGMLFSFVPAVSVHADTQNDDVTLALVRDAEIYAEYEGITVDEALYRFSLLDTAGPMQSEITEKEKGTFGGCWIEHNPEYKFVFLFTEKGRPTINKYLGKYPELADYIEIRNTEITLENLIKEQQQVTSAVHHAGIMVASNADVKTSTIQLYVENVPELEKEKNVGNIQFPDNVVVIPVESLDNDCTDMIGGDAITGGAYGATTGFAVEDQYDNRYITTAGHFRYDVGGPTAYYQGTYQLYCVGYDYSMYNTRMDCAYYIDETDQLDVTNRINDSLSTDRGIIWIENYSSIWIGEYIYKYGESTGLTVGQVESKLFGPYGNNTGQYVWVESISGQLCQDGDSGAPCFRGNIAIGILKGQHPSIEDDMLFSAVSFLPSDLGVTVLTEP